MFVGENLDNALLAKSNLSFHFIHPSIIDLYISALSLHILQERLNKTDPNHITCDIQSEVDKAASEYVISVKKAEELFKDPNIVQKQLDVFTTQRQGIA